MSMAWATTVGYLVPEVMFIKYTPAWFICIPRFMPGI